MSRSTEATTTVSDHLGAADLHQQQLSDAQRENDSLKMEIEDLRKQIDLGEERLQNAIEQEGSHEAGTGSTQETVQSSF